MFKPEGQDKLPLRLRSMIFNNLCLNLIKDYSMSNVRAWLNGPAKKFDNFPITSYSTTCSLSDISLWCYIRAYNNGLIYKLIPQNVFPRSMENISGRKINLSYQYRFYFLSIISVHSENFISVIILLLASISRTYSPVFYQKKLHVFFEKPRYI